MNLVASDRIVLLLARLTKNTGNFSTAHRIRHYLESQGLRCILVDPSELAPEAYCICPTDAVATVERRKVILCVCLHALHCSKSLIDFNDEQGTACILIFGGTDLNEYHKDAHHLHLMTEAVSRAKLCIVFSHGMKEQALKLWPLCKEKLRIIPQGIRTCPTAFSLKAFLLRQYGLKDPDVFLLVASVRKVKDPLFLVSAFSEWHKNHSKSFLVLAGPQVEHELENVFLEEVKQSPGVLYIGCLEQGDLHAAMTECVAVVNSSLSEGMCGAILEAWSMRALVIARAVPGNTDLVEHNKTGLLYGTPQDFIGCVERVLDDASLRSTIIDNAYAVVTERYSTSREQEAYGQVVADNLGLQCARRDRAAEVILGSSPSDP